MTFFVFAITAVTMRLAALVRTARMRRFVLRTQPQIADAAMRTAER
jgi:hypothetical protein